jgi:tRNA G18 (ribose-2'-O)-methylase SpoU
MRKLANSELGRMSMEEFRNAEKHPFTIILDNIRSMHNVGAIFRTADAFRIEEVLLCGHTACPPHREIQRTALDATESVQWQHFSETREAIAYLRQQNYGVFGLEQTDHSVMLQDVRLPAHKKIAFIVGNEIRGIDPGLLEDIDGCWEIPQFGTKHSLNVGVSAGIVLWHLMHASLLNQSIDYQHNNQNNAQ